MTDLIIKIPLDKQLANQLLEDIKPFVEDYINKRLAYKMNGLFMRYYKYKDIEQVREKVMKDLEDNPLDCF